MTMETGSADRTPVRVGIVVGLLVVGVITVAVLGNVLADAFTQAAPVTTTVQAGIPVTVDVPEGASARSIGNSFESAGVVSQQELVRLVEQEGIAAQLKPGTYNLETGMTPEQVAARLLAGPDVIAKSVIILEGVTVSAAIEDLASQTDFSVEDFAEPLRNGRVISPYLAVELPDGVDELSRWEGLLYPARYEIADDATPRQILQLMADEMVHRIAEIDLTGLDDLGVTPYEAIVLASLIQREAGVEEDRPLIASVIYNRMGLSMPLQIDATVVYALGGSPGRVLAEHLRIESPWNTYLIQGLPPTPIGTVQIESLLAAVNPARTDFIFYVLVSDDGRHGFSVTYEEHQAKIEQAKADGVLP